MIDPFNPPIEPLESWCMENEDWRTWLEESTGGAAHQAVLRKIGLSPTTVGRWVRNGRIPADGAILIARAYSTDPVLALLRTGWLIESDFTEGGLRGAVGAAPMQFLTEEMHERARRQPLRFDL